MTCIVEINYILFYSILFYSGTPIRRFGVRVAYFHGVKTRLSTLGTGDVARGSDSM